MADNNLVYNIAKANFHDGTIDWDTSTGIKVALVSTKYVANADHDNFDIAASTMDPATHEISSTSAGYSSGGAALAGRSVTEQDANDRAVLDANDSTWGGLDAPVDIGGAVVYHVPSGQAANSSNWVLICYNNSTTAFPFTSNGGDFTIQWSTAGVLNLS